MPDRPVAAPSAPTPAALRERVAAIPANVGELRRVARRWLSSVLDDHDVVDDLTLAISEALENVVDHAFVDRPVGSMTLTCRKTAGPPRALEIVVADDGRWQRIGEPGARGRGLGLIVQLCSSHVVHTDATGTRVVMRHEF